MMRGWILQAGIKKFAGANLEIITDFEKGLKRRQAIMRGKSLDIAGGPSQRPAQFLLCQVLFHAQICNPVTYKILIHDVIPFFLVPDLKEKTIVLSWGSQREYTREHPPPGSLKFCRGHLG